MNIINNIKKLLPLFEPNKKLKNETKNFLAVLLKELKTNIILDNDNDNDNDNDMFNELIIILDKKKVDNKIKQFIKNKTEELIKILETKIYEIHKKQNDRQLIKSTNFNQKLNLEELEEHLDNQIHQYNKYTETNPMLGISRSKERKKWRLRIPKLGIDKYNNQLENLTEQVKDLICPKNNKKIIQKLEFHKNYNNCLISYKYENNELFDIWHIINLLSVKNKYEKFNEYKKEIKFYFFKKNKFGGFITKNLVDTDTIKKIVLSSNKPEIIKLANLIGINILNNLIITKEQKYLDKIICVFKNEKIITQCYIDKYRVDLYFPEYKLAIECDEFDHKGRSPIKEKERENYICNIKKCKFIRFNPYDANFDIFEYLNKIYKHISTYNYNKKQMKLGISKRMNKELKIHECEFKKFDLECEIIDLNYKDSFNCL